MACFLRPLNRHYIDGLRDALQGDRLRSGDRKARRCAVHGIDAGEDLPTGGETADPRRLVDASSGKEAGAASSLRVV